MRYLEDDAEAIRKGERGEPELLTGPQEIALRAVMEGENYKSAALRAKVTRETVSRWANGDTAWARERRRRTEALLHEYQNEMVMLLELALGAHNWLLHNANYLGEHYDPRTQLGAVALAYRITGIDPGRAAPFINLTVAQQATATTSPPAPDAGGPIREVNDERTAS